MLLLFCLAILYKALFSQVLYSSAAEVGSRYNFGLGRAGTPKVAFDDVSIDNSLVEGRDSISVAKVRVGIRRSPGAPATDVNIYFTPFQNGSTDAKTWVKTPPVLLGTVSLPPNGSTLATTVVSVGDGSSVLFKMKTDTSAFISGYHTFFMGTALSNPNTGNGLRFTSGPPANKDSVWIYDADSASVAYPAKFDNVAARFYIEVFGPTQSLLPITLTEFTGKQTRAGANVLTWVTETEQSNKGFEVQRSADAITFSPVNFVAAKGVTAASTVYQYLDEHPLEGDNYYRLKQVDKDDRFTLSKVVLLKNDRSSRLQISNPYPNPVVSVLNVSIASPASNDIDVSVLDFSGKVLTEKTEKVVNGLNRFSFDVSKLSSGSYNIKVTSKKDGTTVMAMFVKR